MSVLTTLSVKNNILFLTGGDFTSFGSFAIKDTNFSDRILISVFSSSFRFFYVCQH